MERTEFLNGGGGGGGGSEGNNGLGHEGEEERPSHSKMALCIFLLKRRVHYLPVITAIFIIASLFITYAVAVSHGHVEPDFPYISYTAIKAPGRCIFAQLINIGAFLMGANVYVRFLQQRELYKSHGHPARGDPKDRQLAIAALICGCLSALGLSIVANFQTVVMRPPHYLGAGLAFGMGVAYCWLQTSISLRHHPRGRVTIAQLAISVLLSLFLLTFAVSKTIFKVKQGRGEGTREGELRAVYLVSTISEWLTVIAVVVFALTFYPDFSTLTLHGPRVRFTRGVMPGNREDNGHLPMTATANHGSNHDVPPV
ncbi:hypothetical protein ACOMHN_032531 [Nucella lapillus]